MTIYILDNDPKLCAQYLDDKSLDKMIKDIAHVLVNTHYFYSAVAWKVNYELPLKLCLKVPILEWCQWARECKANYLYFVELGMYCCVELMLHRRILKCKKYQLAIDWAANTVPPLSSGICNLENDNLVKIPNTVGQYAARWGDSVTLDLITPFPLVMPKKYRYYTTNDHIDTILSYRNYYQAKLKQQLNSCSLNHIELTNNENDCIKWTRRNKPEWLSI